MDKSGVFPLVCAVCKRIVGVVNVSEFLRMTGAEEIYICSHCMRRPERYVEFTLRGFTPNQWADMTVSVAQHSDGTTVAGFNHSVPVVRLSDPLDLVALI